MLHPLSVIAFAATAIFALPSIRADVPRPPPKDYEVPSPNGRYVAKMTVVPPKTTVYEKRDGVETATWSIDIFHSEVFLADDGQHLVAMNDELLPIGYSPEMVIIRFVEGGRVSRNVTLRDLMPDFSKIVPTVSHYHWGDVSGLNERGELVVETVDYRELHFDAKTGRLLKTERRYREWLRDLLSPPWYHLPLSCVVGLIVGIAFRGRIRAACVTNVGIAIALLLFVLWIIGSFTSLGDEFTVGGYNWITGLAIIWLVPSTLLTVVVSILWRIARRSRLHPQISA